MRKSIEKEAALSHEKLMGLLDYDKDTGIFVWKVTRNKHVAPAGSVAGTASGRRKPSTTETQTERIIGSTIFAKRLIRKIRPTSMVSDVPGLKVPSAASKRLAFFMKRISVLTASDHISEHFNHRRRRKLLMPQRRSACSAII